MTVAGLLSEKAVQCSRKMVIVPDVAFVMRMVDILIGFSSRSKRTRAVTGEGRDSCCPEVEKRGRLSSSSDIQ